MNNLEMIKNLKQLNNDQLRNRYISSVERLDSKVKTLHVTVGLSISPEEKEEIDNLRGVVSLIEKEITRRFSCSDIK